MQKLKVLSIDFDFFQKVNKETIRNCYPDGLDVPTYVSCITWAGRYAYSGKELSKVKADTDKLSEIEQIIGNMRYTSPVMVCNSHKYCYQFIKDNYDTSKFDGVELVNIDMHHDLFNNNPDLDCGNWISHVKEEIPCEVTWIANPISKSVYGMKEDVFSCVKENFSEIEDKTFDILFLCRSDTWTPPHLDKHFDELLEYIKDNFVNMSIDSQIVKPREIKKEVEFIKTCKGIA